MGFDLTGQIGQFSSRYADGSLDAISPCSLSELLSLSLDRVERTDIARVNLLCADGLPGAEALDIDRCLATLDAWARAVNRYTQDAKHHYYARPQDYQDHRGVFCFMSMVTLLKHPRGLDIGYSPTAIGNYDFSNSQDDLLHGLLTRKLGTCASLPVLFIAIGRRLGYPMHLAVAKGHVLCQWVNERGRFNLEGSCGGGGDCKPDEHYHEWPHQLTQQELVSGRYLRPLSRAEELALFLETRGHCLTDNRRFDEARQAYAQAHRVAPQWSQMENHLYAMRHHEARAQGRWTDGMLDPWQRQYPTINAPGPNQGLFPTLISLPGLTH